MAKKKTSSGNSFESVKHHLIPSIAGGGVAYALTGAALLGLAVFATVWAGNAISHHLHKK